MYESTQQIKLSGWTIKWQMKFSVSQYKDGKEPFPLLQVASLDFRMCLLGLFCLIQTCPGTGVCHPWKGTCMFTEHWRLLGWFWWVISVVRNQNVFLAIWGDMSSICRSAVPSTCGYCTVFELQLNGSSSWTSKRKLPQFLIVEYKTFQMYVFMDKNPGFLGKSHWHYMDKIILHYVFIDCATILFPPVPYGKFQFHHWVKYPQ